MIKRSFRYGVLVGLLAGAAATLVKLFGGRSAGAPVAALHPSTPWPRLEEDPAVPAPPRTSLQRDPDAPTPKRAPRTTPLSPAASTDEASTAPVGKPTAKRKAPVRAWVEPEGSVCPTSHPIKAKLASKIFHQPGMLNYGRTRPDRCYLNEASAEADGLRPAKR